MALLPVERRLLSVDLFWNRVNLPKQRFILWLETLGRLLTKDKLEKMGLVCENKVYVICTEVKEEDATHLFQQCTWTKKVWSAVREWIGVYFR